MEKLSKTNIFLACLLIKHHSLIKRNDMELTDFDLKKNFLRKAHLSCHQTFPLLLVCMKSCDKLIN